MCIHRRRTSTLIHSTSPYGCTFFFLRHRSGYYSVSEQTPNCYSLYCPLLYSGVKSNLMTHRRTSFLFPSFQPSVIPSSALFLSLSGFSPFAPLFPPYFSFPVSLSERKFPSFKKEIETGYGRDTFRPYFLKQERKKGKKKEKTFPFLTIFGYIVCDIQGWWNWIPHWLS